MTYAICIIMILIVITLGVLDTYELFKKPVIKKPLVRVVKYTIIIENKDEQIIDLKQKKVVKRKSVVKKKVS